MFNGKTILITGGTGSFGRACAKRILDQYSPRSLRIFSRDELKQWEMSSSFSKHKKSNKLRFFIGDIRDKDRLKRALEGCDIVIHAAALKQIPTAEYNPMECIKTNILGAQNLVDCTLDLNIGRVIALSTDKATAPINLYGASKLCAEKLFIAANNMKGNKKTIFSIIRYGNVMGSRGSVIPLFLKNKEEGKEIPVTDHEMTRFNFLPDEAIDLAFYAIKNCWGGEIYIPKIPSYRIMDLVKAIAPKAKIKIVGIRPGEKLHEEMITANDSASVVELNKYYVILPQSQYLSWTHEQFIKKMKAKEVEPGFNYSSKNNKEWLTVEEIRTLIKKHIEPNFKV